MNWLFNVVLFLCFLFNRPLYDAKVAAGVPCWTAFASSGVGGTTSFTQPLCWYDPTNTNPGYLPGSPELPFVTSATIEVTEVEMSQKRIRSSLQITAAPVVSAATVHLPIGRTTQALEVLSRFGNYGFPADQGRLRFAVARTFAALCADPNVIACEKSRQAAINHHGKPNEKGEMAIHPGDPSAWAEFLAEYGPIADTEVEIHVPKIPATIVDCVPPGITPNDLISIMPFIED